MTLSRQGREKLQNIAARKVECSLCGKKIRKVNLKRHKAGKNCAPRGEG